MGFCYWFKRLFGGDKIVTIQQLSDEVGKGNFSRLGQWLEWHIWYKPDATTADNWKKAEQTLQDEAGDCEDFAIVAYEVLHLWGVKATILCAFPVKGAGHAVCAFKKDSTSEKWSCYSNGMLHKDIGTTLKDVAEFVAYEAHWKLANWNEYYTNGYVRLLKNE